MAIQRINSEKRQAYAVESGIPIAAGKYAKHLYPFATMNVGDSFELTSNDFRELERVRSAVQAWQRRHVPMKFAVRISDPMTKAYRCWRIA